MRRAPLADPSATSDAGPSDAAGGMRILIIGINYAPEPIGIAPYTAAMARELARRGDAVRVITTMPHYPQWRVQPGYGGWSRSEADGDVAVRRLRHYVPRRPVGMRRLLSEISFGLRALVTRWDRPDVVVFVSPALFSTGIAMLRARLTRRPSVVWVQDLYSLGMTETATRESGDAATRVITAVEAAVVRRAQGVCVIHERFQPPVEALGADPARIRVMRNWAHLAALPLRSRPSERAALGWGTEIRAVHTGAMGKKQDLGNVVHMARRAHEAGIDLKVMVIGNGSEREEVERLAAGLPTVEVLDPLPDEQYQAVLLAADVLLLNEHPNLREMAVPSKLTSYFSSGRPVVAATDAGSTSAGEIAAAKAGVRVEPGDPEALLAAVVDLGRDTARADALGAAGRAYRDSVLLEGAAVANFSSWLQDVVERSGRLRRGPTTPVEAFVHTGHGRG